MRVISCDPAGRLRKSPSWPTRSQSQALGLVGERLLRQALAVDGGADLGALGAAAAALASITGG